MRVLHISPSPPEYLGGLAHFTKFLAMYLGENNIHVDLLCSTLSKEGSTYEQYSKNFKVIKKKCYYLADNDNLLKMKNPIFNTLTYLLRYGKNYDIIHVHSYIYFSTIQTFFYKLIFGRKIPTIMHLHGILEDHESQTTNKIEKILFFFKKFFFDYTIGRIMLNKADSIISVNSNDISILNEVFHVNFVNKHKTFFIPNAIDPDKFKRIDNIKREYIGYVQRLSIYSGIDLFLDLVKEYNKIDKSQKFLIVGKGPYLPEVKKAMEKYPITYYEEVPHEDMPKIYNSCSIFVLISRSEGLSTVLLEALACEVPCIASKVGGNPELVKDGITGYLFESANIEQAIEKIQKINNNKEHRELGINGRKLVKNHFTWEKNVKKIISIYKKLIKK